MYLGEEDEDPELEEWDNTQLMTFTLPQIGKVVSFKTICMYTYNI